MGDIVNAVADVFGVGPASKQAEAVQSAAETGAGASRYAAEVQRQMFERQVALQEPWRQAGAEALNKLIPIASEYTPFGMQQFQQDPGYGFRLSEGMKALERSAAARGGLMSGAQMKGIQRFGQNLASEEYQNAFARYQREREARLNPLQSLAGVGQTSAQTLGSQAGDYGTRMANIALQGGATAGAAQLAAGNVRASQYGGYGQALGTALGNQNVQNYFSNLFGGPGMGQSEYSKGWNPENYG
jgi:hypothetical protein